MIFLIIVFTPIKMLACVSEKIICIVESGKICYTRIIKFSTEPTQ